jgi:hypothetical protein
MWYLFEFFNNSSFMKPFVIRIGSALLRVSQEREALYIISVGFVKPYLSTLRMSK